MLRLPAAVIFRSDVHQVVQWSACCSTSNQCYIRQTGRVLGKTVKEHKIEMDKILNTAYTCSNRRHEKDIRKSAITGHARHHKHVIDWKGASPRPGDWPIQKLGMRCSVDPQNVTHHKQGWMGIPTELRVDRPADHCTTSTSWAISCEPVLPSKQLNHWFQCQTTWIDHINPTCCKAEVTFFGKASLWRDFM